MYDIEIIYFYIRNIYTYIYREGFYSSILNTWIIKYKPKVYR